MSDVDLYYKYYSDRQVTMHFFAHLQTDNLLRLLILDNNRVFTVVNKELVSFIELTNQSSDFNVFHYIHINTLQPTKPTTKVPIL